MLGDQGTASGVNFLFSEILGMYWEGLFWTLGFLSGPRQYIPTVLYTSNIPQIDILKFTSKIIYFKYASKYCLGLYFTVFFVWIIQGSRAFDIKKSSRTSMCVRG